MGHLTKQGREERGVWRCGRVMGRGSSGSACGWPEPPACTAAGAMTERIGLGGTNGQTGRRGLGRWRAAAPELASAERLPNPAPPQAAGAPNRIEPRGEAAPVRGVQGVTRDLGCDW